MSAAELRQAVVSYTNKTGDLVNKLGIAVWLRHQAEESRGVGYLYIKLEDLSMPPLDDAK
jgi:hypothetical protein